jgi:hypothetical protein
VQPWCCARRPGWSPSSGGGVVGYWDHGLKSVSVASPGAVAGVWQLQGGSGRLVLGADGRFTATGIPDEVFTDNGSAPWVMNATGTWSLDPVRGDVVLAPGRGQSDGTGYPDLGIYEVQHAQRLCIYSQTQGVMCDYLFQRAPGR